MDEDDFSNMIKKIQNKIKKDEEEIYSKKVIYEYNNPTNFGKIQNPDAKSEIKGPCGDTMKIELKIENDTIKEARFWTDGCGATIACGNMLTKMIKGKSLSKLKDIDYYDLLESLEGLPLEHTHCSILAINTLNKAIHNYKKNKLYKKI